MQIEPLYTLALSYQLSDPSDTGTYYVRAVLRNTLTSAVISTVNLTSQGSGRFTGNTLAPADPTGQGFHMDATITVYTDSGYTTPSDVYQKENRNYLVRTANRNLGGGGGGGTDVDYDKIQRLIKAEIAALVALLPKETDFSGVFASLEKLQESIDELPEPPEATPATDLTPVLEGLELVKGHVSQTVSDIEFPEQEKLDLSPVTLLMEEFKEKLAGVGDLTTTHKEELTNQMKEMVKGLENATNERSKKTWDTIQKFLAGIGSEGDIVPVPKPIPSKFAEFFPIQKDD